MTDARAFRGFRFPAEIILWAVRWYLQFPIGYRDLERMLADRGVAVDHVSLYRWVQRFAPELEKLGRRELTPGMTARIKAGLAKARRMIKRRNEAMTEDERQLLLELAHNVRMLMQFTCVMALNYGVDMSGKFRAADLRILQLEEGIKAGQSMARLAAHIEAEDKRDA